MKYDVRVEGKTIMSFETLYDAKTFKSGYQIFHPGITVVVVKDYGKAGE
ncbi:hypothetical protein [Leuconostoc citreum]|nr:hypothetical protein [Leuconostoc citreum]MBE4726240.1 hypothetical protein [Leuconostoc citreum]